ncbi:MAG: ABC-type transport auxiliary lipoprotein family protein [Gammaproteobacteria bacterium]|nr:ABC-type transport auxiliary lipoprotein family protein [Gammaproteobacteria bacterium]
MKRLSVTTRSYVLRSALVVCAICMGGCGALIETEPPPDLYSLTPKSTFPESMPLVDWQLVIEEPSAARGLDTPRIAVRPSPTQLQYVAGSRWTSRAPKMVQTLLVESFENSGKIVAVGRQAIGLRSDYNLKTELREFQAEYYDGEKIGLVRVRINAKLIKQPEQEIIASENFERVVRPENEGMQAIVNAFDRALGSVMKKLVEWALVTPVS